jgi:demethylmenaquinone methyltransferase/2-methoxy-6-polyprenyl-1,4-benzoquinol methylase
MTLKSALATPDAKRRHVRQLFHTIADRYDLITVLLSFGRDRAWKRRLIDEAAIAGGDRGLDLACGTGDITFAAARAGASMIGLDVTHRMIQLAMAKHLAGRTQDPGLRTAFLTGDMMALPFPPASFDLVTTGYGLRNVPELGPAIDEIVRVLRPGGRLLSLDFNRPANVLVRGAYLTYLTIVGATLGWVLHRDPDTYRYIPESIRRYPGARAVGGMLSARGFVDVRVVPILGGLMALHIASRAPLKGVPYGAVAKITGPGATFPAERT